MGQSVAWSLLSFLVWFLLSFSGFVVCSSTSISTSTSKKIPNLATNLAENVN
jgi:hypothetical protein